MYGSREQEDYVPLISRTKSAWSWKPLVVFMGMTQLALLVAVGVLLTRTAGLPPAIAPLSMNANSVGGSLRAPPSTVPSGAVGQPAAGSFSEKALAELRERASNNNPSVDFSLRRMPHKLALDHVTPRQDQMQRGTCWDFATIGMLEHSYRAQGTANGWLQPDEYVKLSEQAYGVTVLERCHERPNTCLIPGDNIWMNSTEGGEIPLLYYLPEVNNSILPDAVCPYISTASDKTDRKCPGRRKALQANPLKFEIRGMDTLYEINSIKQHLIQNRRVLGFSTPMSTVSYFYPCTGKMAKRPECQAQPCKTPCPFDKFPAGSCCVRVGAPNYNREGEFYTHGNTDRKDGGHAMLLVGYNDNYVTETGDVGGFILKNNWQGGSHSVQYFMQEISRWDESRICPNSRNPRNWYDCQTIENCLSEETRLYSEVSFQPLELKCVNPALCNAHERFHYFVKNASHAGDNMVEMWFFEYDTKNGGHREFLLGPLPLDDYATIFSPVKIHPDDPDRCGFYFFPYKLAQTTWRQFLDGFATDFDTVWHPQSYIANAAQYPDVDYSLVKASTLRQNVYVFSGPFPQDMVTNQGKPLEPGQIAPDEKPKKQLPKQTAQILAPEPAPVPTEAVRLLAAL